MKTSARMRWVGFVVLGATALLGCRTATVQSDIRMTEVRRPEDATKRWGDYEIREAEEEGYTYEDDLVQIVAVPLSSGMFVLSIDNKTEHSLQLVWDQMSFVGPDGSASAVSSGDTRIMNVGQESQPPTPIPAKASVEVTAIPNDLVSGTSVSPLFSVADSANFGEYEGQNMRLIVPLQVEDTVNEYTLVFNIRDLRVAEPR